MSGNGDLRQDVRQRRPNLTARHEPEVLRANVRAKRDAAVRRALVTVPIIALIAYVAIAAYWLVPAIARLAGF